MATIRTLETVLAGSPHHRDLIEQGYKASFTRDGITYLEAPIEQAEESEQAEQADREREESEPRPGSRDRYEWQHEAAAWQRLK